MSRDLAGFTGQGYDIGRGRFVQTLWYLISGILVTRWWCPAGLRRGVLRMFGASIAPGVLVRHGVKIHWPWKLTVGANSWIGERAWILNLEPVTIGADVCISQEAFICTGSHDRHSPTFEFDNAPVVIKDEAWVGTRAVVLRGVTVGEGAVLGATVVAARDVPDGATLLPPRPQLSLATETPTS